MRRPIVPLSSFAVAVALTALAMLVPAPASAIVCPASSPCCPVPTQAVRSGAPIQPVCCPPTTCCATGTTSSTACCPSAGCCTSPCPAAPVLTISASPNPSRAGRQVVIAGAFTGNPQPGSPVVLWRELPGQSSFHELSQTTADGSGHYAFTLGPGSVMADQAWYVTSGALRSSTIQQTVAALVGLSPSTRSTAVGRVVRVSGRVTPSHRGEVVLIEARRAAGAWRVIARRHLSRSSTYAVFREFARPGAVQLRAVLPGDERNERSVSPTATVRVKA